MAQGAQSWTLAIFGLNEEKTLPAVVAACEKLLNEWNRPPHEILIIDDGSTDHTPQVARQLAVQNPNIRVVIHPTNKGIGHALLSCYSEARMENVVAIPADGQWDVDELRPYPELPPQSILSFVRTTNTSYTPYRKFLSAVNRKLNAIGLSMRLRDVNWIKAYKTNEVRNLNLEMRTVLIESEICAKLLAKGNTVREVDSVYLPRESGKSHAVKLRIVLPSLLEYWKLLKSVRKFRRDLGRKAGS